MNDKIGFVAVGQAGGNIGQLLEQKGYTVLYLNTSMEDLSTLSDGTHKYHINGGEGCNKDRTKAKQLIIDDFDNIASKIDDTIDARLIYVIFASGGGTGSGAGPMLVDLLLDEGNHNVGVITVLPAQKESIKSQYNAYECFSELTSITSSAGCFIIDNDNGDRFSLNQRFVENFDSFVSIPRTYTSEKGNIDVAEIQEVLKTHGMSLIVTSEESKLSTLIPGIRNGIYAPAEPDKKVKYMALAADDTVSDVSELIKEFGTPLDVYRAYTTSKGIVCMAGCSYPYERLGMIREIVQANKDVIVNTASAEPRLQMDFDFLGAKTCDTNTVSKPKSRKDIMSKYLK